MAIPLMSGFSIGGSDSVDSRLVLTKAEMLAMKDSGMPDTYFCTDKDTGDIYTYNKTNTVDPATGKFRKFAGGGGSGVLADYGTKAEFEAKKDSLPDGTVFTTTDEYEELIPTKRFVNVGTGSQVSISTSSSKPTLIKTINGFEKGKNYLVTVSMKSTSIGGSGTVYFGLFEGNNSLKTYSAGNANVSASGLTYCYLNAKSESLSFSCYASSGSSSVTFNYTDVVVSYEEMMEVI